VLDLGGVVTAAGMERYFRKHVLPTNRFQDLQASLFLVATQVNGSRKVVFGSRDSLGDQGYGADCAWYDNVEISEALAAAVSLPPLFAPYAIANAATGKLFHYHDGEVREPLSLHVARDVGADFAIASSMWRPYAWHERVGSLADFGMLTLAEQAIHQAIEQKVARELAHAEQVEHALALLDEYGQRHGIAPESLESLKQQVCAALRHRRMRVLHVSPEPSDAEFFFEGSFRFNPAMIQRCEDAGYRAYRHAARSDPGFFGLLDEVLGTGSPGAKVIELKTASARVRAG
jgi:predicted acylesterase/phospholipase RssA